MGVKIQIETDHDVCWDWSHWAIAMMCARLATACLGFGGLCEVYSTSLRAAITRVRCVDSGGTLQHELRQAACVEKPLAAAQAG